jgi:hypothetical protein
LINKTAIEQVKNLMTEVVVCQEKELPIPEIRSRNGEVVSDESILVRISNLKLAFPDWSFYTRTCQQTQRKIIGARPVKEVR